MYKRLTLLVIAGLCLLLSTPVIAAEINLGGGYPLWDTHTDDETTGLDGGYLFYASVDKVKKDSKWLSYGLMYNYARIEMKWEDTTTKYKFKEWQTDEVICRDCDFETTTTTKYEDWLNVHVLGPYVKPFYKVGRVKLFGMIGVGGMYVDGAIYGDEFGGAGFVSTGLSLDITEHLGMGAQLLYVKGYTSHVDDIDYLAPVATLSYRW